MSKYHKLARLAKQDWITVAGVIASLRGVLELGGYGTEFQVFRDGLPIDEEAARQAIIDEVTTSPLIEKYQRILQEMVDDGSIKSWEVYVEPDPSGGLMFKHGDFEPSLSLGDFEVVTGAKEVEQRHKRRTKTQINKEDKAQKLKDKLDDTRNTDKNAYLAHANYCGFLVSNTSIRFNKSAKDQWGTSVITRIRGITLQALRGFTDSTGKETLSAISTHVSELDDRALSDDADDAPAGIEAMHRDFAHEIVDFLNLEFVVDIDGLAATYGEQKADSRSMPIEHWGGSREVVLGKLTERRPECFADSEEITEWFDLGCESNLA